MSKLLVLDPEFCEKLSAIEQESIASFDEKLAPFLTRYRDFVGADAPADIRMQNLDAILRVQHASLLGVSSKVLYETFADLVWPRQNELERRATVGAQAIAAIKETLRRGAEEIVSLRKARMAAGGALPGGEHLNQASELVEAMVTFAQAELNKSADRRRLLQKIKSSVRAIRWARFVWRVGEILAIVVGGLAVERINEWIKEQVVEWAGPGSMGDSTWAAIVGAIIWFVAAGFVIWFHDEVVNEWMRRWVDGRRREEIMDDMRRYFSDRMSLEYVLGLMEHLVAMAPRVKVGPGATGSSEPRKPTGDEVP
jgi:hypothetical protein